MRRRTLLALIGTGTLSTAGCIGETDPANAGSPTTTGEDTGSTDDTPTTATDAGGTDERTRETTDDGADENTDLPEDCPTTQGLDVEWPEELDDAAVESFVEAYEHAYYRDVVVEYEPESQADSYDLSGGVNSGPSEVGDGWRVSYSGSGGVYRPTLSLQAATADPLDGADVVPVGEIDDAALTETLEAAAETGEADHHVEPPGEEVDRYIDLLASLSDDFEALSEPGDSDSLFVDVDGTTVELTAQADNFHGDYWWDASYYVTDRVVRRASGEDADPRDGELLECREAD